MDIPVGGFQKQSLIDFPGYISSIIFTKGCNFNCSYCHNPELIRFDKNEENNLKISDVLIWIKSNSVLLDAVVITGGEPTLHKSLPEAIKVIKSLGLKVKLDTNGTNPDMLRLLLSENLIDYLAMDIKAALHYTNYKGIAGNCFSKQLFDSILRSIRIINSCKIEYEYRTTFDKSLNYEDIVEIATHLTGTYYIQQLSEYRNKIRKPSNNNEFGKVVHLISEIKSKAQLKIRK